MPEIKYDEPKTTFAGFIKRWINKDLGKKRICGNYKSDKEMKTLYYEGGGRRANYGKDILAIRLDDGRVIGNASKLDRCGSYRKGDEAPAQRIMFEENIAMVPFNVFEETGMDIQKIDIVYQGEEEDFLLPRLKWNEETGMLQPVEIRKKVYQEKTKPKNTKKKKILKSYKYKSVIYNKKTKKSEKVTVYDYTYLDLSELTDRHFVGAMILKLGKKYYLFDVDRQELKHYRFNPFLTELPKKATTLKEAYELLEPEEVKKAKKQGKDVKRQGEWFFIPTNKEFEEPEKPRKMYKTYDLSTTFRNLSLRKDKVITLKRVKETEYFLKLKPKYRKMLLDRVRDYKKAVKAIKETKDDYDKKYEAYRSFHWGGNLQAGDNRPNRADQMYMDLENDETYVTGEIRHIGREHEPIKLEKWHRAIPNTAIKSFTITGNID